MRRYLPALLCLGLLLAPCLAGETIPPIPVQDYPGTIPVACVGDSITFGAGVKDRVKNSYPAVLGRLLGEKWEVKNFGVSGATMLRKGDKPYSREGAFKAALAFKPNVVTIKLGTNDTKPQNWKHKDEFEADAKFYIQEFRKVDPKVRVYICLPVPAFPGNWGIDDTRIREEAIPILRKVAKDCECPVIDLYSVLEGKKQLVPDKVHPNAEGAALIARRLYQVFTGKEAPAEAGK